MLEIATRLTNPGTRTFPEQTSLTAPNPILLQNHVQAGALSFIPTKINHDFIVKKRCPGCPSCFPMMVLCPALLGGAIGRNKCPLKGPSGRLFAATDERLHRRAHTLARYDGGHQMTDVMIGLSKTLTIGL